MGIPSVALVFGNSTAGGAYVPGMCDYAVLVDNAAKVFLGGPPLVKMAIDEDADEEELGGADMHSRISGLADFLATDEADALRKRLNVLAPPFASDSARLVARRPSLPSDSAHVVARHSPLASDSARVVAGVAAAGIVVHIR
jgi:acetyl-CoA carboxylase carboxyltransferase component